MLGTPCGTTPSTESRGLRPDERALPPGRSRLEARLRKKREASEEGAEEHRLVESARHGDTLAFRTLVERHRGRALAIATRILRNPHDAEEVVQEAFFRSYLSLSRFHGESSFFTWLYRIVKNLALDALRASGKPPVEPSLDPALVLSGDHPDALLASSSAPTQPLDDLFRRELAADLRDALSALPAYHRDIVILCAVEEMSYDELSTKLKISRGTLMSRFFYARKKLRRALSARYPEGRFEG